MESNLAASHRQGDDVESFRRIKKVVCKTADTGLGIKKKSNKKDLFDKGCKSALQISNEKRMKTLQRRTRGNIREYEEARRQVKNICKTKKRFTRRNNLRSCRNGNKATK
jgi:hypothetical protein